MTISTFWHWEMADSKQGQISAKSDDIFQLSALNQNP